MAVGGSNHFVLDLPAALFIGVGDGLEVPCADPVEVATAVSDGLGKFPGLDPAVDVHVDVELLRSVTQHQREDAANGVGFPVAHDEFAFVVAHLAIGPG